MTIPPSPPPFHSLCITSLMLCSSSTVCSTGFTTGLLSLRSVSSFELLFLQPVPSLRMCNVTRSSSISTVPQWGWARRVIRLVRLVSLSLAPSAESAISLVSRPTLCQLPQQRLGCGKGTIYFDV